MTVLKYTIIYFMVYFIFVVYFKSLMEDFDTLIKYTVKNIKEHDADVVDFAFYRFAQFLKDAPHLSEPHRHDFYALIYTINGNGSHSIDFEEYPIAPNRLFFINYDQIHSWNIASHVEGYILLFSKSFYNLIFTGNDLVQSDTAVESLPVYIDIPEEEKHFWLNIFENIKLEFQKKNGYSREVICLLLKTCVLKMSSASENSKFEASVSDHKGLLVSEFRTLVNLHFREKKMPKEYAAQLSVTPNYLNAVVKEYLGKPAGNVIKNRIVLEAIRLLSHTKLSVRQISLELGFSDNSHFGKYFKNSTGQTPETFRKNLRQ